MLKTILIKSLLTILFLGGVFSLAGLLTWVERKQSALIQDRIGANRAWIRFKSKWMAPANWLLSPFNRLGLFHPLADVIKMFTKEDFLPKGADRFLHTLAPMLVLTTAMLSFCVIPFGDTIRIGSYSIELQIAGFNAGILLLLAIFSLGIYGVMLAGFASPNNFASLGSLRAASQTLSYEIPLILSASTLIMSYGTLDLQQMTYAQGGLLWGVIPKWGIVIQPLAFIIFVTAALCATKRIPFDLPEGESEIIGYFVEYSAMKYGLFFLTDLIETVLAACLVTTFFLGGWQIPFLRADGFRFSGGIFIPLQQEWISLLRLGSYFAKIIVLNWLFMTIRWSFPRFRYDQLLKLGWKILTPLALINFFVTAALMCLL